jgi:hypothetical protein
MGIFSKKKDVEEEDELEEELSLKKKKVAVNKVPREKKKALPKPWGKKERIIVLILVIATAGISAALALSAREWKLPGLPRLAFKMPSISFLKNEKIILEGEGNYKNDMKAGEVILRNFLECTDFIFLIFKAVFQQGICMTKYFRLHR